MKIGIVCYFIYGGSGVVVIEFGFGFVCKGYEVYFIIYKCFVCLFVFYENVVFYEVVIEDYFLFEYMFYDILLASKLVDVVKFVYLDLLYVYYVILYVLVVYMVKKIFLVEGKYVFFVIMFYGIDIMLVGNNNIFVFVVIFFINKLDGVIVVFESLKK